MPKQLSLLCPWLLGKRLQEEVLITRVLMMAPPVFLRKTTRARKGRVVGRVYSAKSRKVLGSIGGKRTKRGGGGGGGKKKASKACQSLDWLVKANVKKKV